MLKNLCANFGVKIAIFCLVHAEHRSLFQTSKSPDPPIAFFRILMLGHSACRAHGSSLTLITRSPASSCPRRLA